MSVFQLSASVLSILAGVFQTCCSCCHDHERTFSVYNEKHNYRHDHIFRPTGQADFRHRQRTERKSFCHTPGKSTFLSLPNYICSPSLLFILFKVFTVIVNVNMNTLTVLLLIQIFVNRTCTDPQFPCDLSLCRSFSRQFFDLVDQITPCFIIELR